MAGVFQRAAPQVTAQLTGQTAVVVTGECAFTSSNSAAVGGFRATGCGDGCGELDHCCKLRHGASDDDVDLVVHAEVAAVASLRGACTLRRAAPTTRWRREQDHGANGQRHVCGQSSQSAASRTATSAAFASWFSVSSMVRFSSSNAGHRRRRGCCSA